MGWRRTATDISGRESLRHAKLAWTVMSSVSTLITFVSLATGGLLLPSWAWMTVTALLIVVTLFAAWRQGRTAGDERVLAAIRKLSKKIATSDRTYLDLLVAHSREFALGMDDKTMLGILFRWAHVPFSDVHLIRGVFAKMAEDDVIGSEERVNTERWFLTDLGRQVIDRQRASTPPP